MDLSDASDPRLGRGALQWRAVPWFVTLATASAWMALLALLLAQRGAGWLALVAGVAFLLVQGVGLALWRHRARLRPLAGALTLLATVALFTGALVLALERTPLALGTSPIPAWAWALFPLALIELGRMELDRDAAPSNGGR